MGNNTDDFFDEKKEWSVIKDQVLSCYLKPYFSKIKTTNKPITYIDGFAGAGLFHDGKKGSPLIAYEVAEEVDQNLNINYVFVEKKYHEELKENAKELKNTRIIAGKYEDNIVDLIKQNIGNNVFIYIDPYGIKNMNFSYFEEMNHTLLYSVEFLMNFNSFGFFREGCRLLKVKCEVEDEFKELNKLSGIEHMNEIAGGTYWQDIIFDYRDGKITAHEAERRFTKQYCDKIMNRKLFEYVINIPLRNKPGNPPKYRLIFGTNHIEGVILMNNNMCKRMDELQDIQTGCMTSLFAQNSENDIITNDEISKNILPILNDKEIEYNEFLFRYIRQYGVTKTSMINECLKKFINDGIIEIRREPATTVTGRKSTFIASGKDKKSYIRKM